MTSQPDRVWAEFDTGAWRGNFRALQAAVSPALVMPVLKADGYGLGALEAGRMFKEAGARYLAVSCLCEALELESLGVPVLILGAPIPGEIALIVSHGLTGTVPDLATAEAMSALAVAAGKRCLVHVKIDTGMGRVGIPVGEAVQSIRRIVALPGLEVEGIYSHFAAAGLQDNLTARQYQSLAEVIRTLEAERITFKYRHIANSTAAAGIPQACRPPFNMVRSGLDLHGAHLSITPRPYQTASVFTLKSRLASVRYLPCGTTVGYGRTYRVDCPEGERVGVVAIGYADGYPRCLSNCGTMLVHGRRCRVVGRVCMDYTMVSLDQVPEAAPGDEVVVIGRQGGEEIALAEVARTAETIPYEIICGLGSRVRRRYSDGRPC